MQSDVSNANHDELRPISGELKRLFRKGWWLILTCAACGLVVGLLRLSRIAPEYAAEARIYVAGQEAPDVPGVGARLAVHRFNAQLGSPAALFQSKELVREAIKIGNLNELSTLQRAPNPVDHILSHMRVVESDGSGRKTQSINLTAEDPVESEKILIALIEACKNYYAEWKEKSNQVVVDALEARRERLTDEYREQLDRREQFQRAHGDAALGDRDLEIQMEQLSNASGRLNRLALDRLEADMKLAWLKATPQAESNRPVELLSVGGDATLIGRLSDSVMARDQEAFETAAQEWGPSHPEYLNAQARVQANHRVMIQVAEAEVARLAEQESALQASLTAQRNEVMAANKDVVALRLIENDVVGIEKLIQAVDDELRSIRLLGQSASAAVIVLEAPRARDLPIEPESARVVMMPAVVGLLLGLALAYWVLPDGRTQRVSGPESIEQALGASVLGVVRAVSPDALLVPGRRTHRNRIRRPVGIEA
jgi:uncharacterized protein involved in exopolysaccharide biosynthesis